MTPIPLSLYIHIPWCVRKCPYCDFNSHQIDGDVPEKAYINALLKDLESELPAIWGRSIESVFIGGGTPSLLSADRIDQLLSALRAMLPIRPLTEITMEANPGTFEQQRFTDYRQAGINRLSIGVQSFNQQHLQALGRIHNAQEAVRAAEIAHHAGFDNFNLDLMFGLPQQSIQQSLQDLQQATKLHPSHISWYQLTLEPNTLFHHQPPRLPDSDLLWEIQQQGQALLHQENYRQYEVSAYTRDKQFCTHNLNYWQFGDYVGIGAGAHGKITSPQGEITRYNKYRNPKDYMKTAVSGEATQKRTRLTAEEISFDFMLNALRLKQGIATELFNQRTRLPYKHIEAKIRTAINKDLLLDDQTTIQTTAKGWDFLNDTIEMFL